MIRSQTKLQLKDEPDVPVVWFVPGPCADPESRRRFISSIQALFDEAEWLGARREVEEAIDRILSVTGLRSGVLVAARGGERPFLWVLPTRAHGPLIELSLPEREERAA